MNKIIDRYKCMPLPAKASLWFVFCSIVQKGIAFLTTPIFTRILSQTDYGVFSIYNSWLSILTIIVTFVLAMGHFNKGMIKYENDRDGYTSSILCLATILVIAYFGMYISFRNFWNRIFELNTTIMVMMFVEILFAESMALWSIRQRFEFRYKGVVFVTLLSNGLGTLLSVFLVLSHDEFQVEYRILGTVIIHVLVYGIIYVLVLSKGRTYHNSEYWKYALRYNLPLIPHYLSLILLNQSDRIMIGRICGSEFSAIYTVAYQVAVIMNIVTNAIHASFTPWAFENIKRKSYYKIGIYTLRLEILFSIGCFLFTLFAPEIVMILGGQGYYAAVWIIPPVTMSVVFNLLYSLISNIEFYYERTKLVMVGTIIAASLNILLNAIFIPIHGFVAAGYTTLACYMILAGLHYCFVRRIFKEKDIENPYNGKKIWLIAYGCVVLSVFSTFLYNYTIIRYIVVITIVFITFIKRNSIIKLVSKNI